MPAEAPPAPPPAAPAAPAAPPAAPAPKGEIQLTPAAIENGPKAVIKKGSAMERLTQDLRKKAKPQFFEQREETPAPEGQTPPDPNAKPEEGTAPKEGTAPAGEQTPPKGEKGKETKNPWKMVDEYKARAAKAESELLEAKKVGGDPAKIKEFQDQITNLRKTNEELETEIRFTNYAKSSEFKAKFKDPYDKAWTRAVKELSEVTVTDPNTGAERAAKVDDLAEIVNLPLGKARAAAEATFGPFADDVMGYRKEILALFEAQETALKDARENSIKRDKEREETIQKTSGEIQGQIKQHWEKANSEWLADEKVGSYFKPVEGDQDGNLRLSKGFELVDRAFSENPNDPNLTAEQRASIIKRHAAVRLRAAGFGRLKAQADSYKARIEALEKELADYKGSVPGVGGTSQASPATEGGSSGWARLRAELQKKAKQQ